MSFTVEEYFTMEEYLLSIRRWHDIFYRRYGSGYCKRSMLYGDENNLFKMFYESDQSDKLCKYVLSDCGRMLMFVKKQTLELCKIAIEEDSRSIEYVNLNGEYYDVFRDYKTNVIKKYRFNKDDEENIQTDELCDLSFKKDPSDIKYFHEQFKTFERCKLALEKNFLNIIYIKSQLNVELVNIAVQSFLKNISKHNACHYFKKCSKYLKYIPYKFKSYNLCKLILEKDGLNLKYVPRNIITSRLCLIAITEEPLSIKYVPKEFKNNKLYELTVKINGMLLRYIEQPTYNIKKIALSNYGRALEYIDNADYELCLIAVKNDGYAIKYVPEKMLTYELYYYAIQSEPESFRLFPENVINGETFTEVNVDELNLFAIQGYPLNLEYIKNQSKLICYLAVLYDTKSIKYITLEEYDDIIIMALQINWKCIEYLNINYHKYIEFSKMAIDIALEKNAEYIGSSLYCSDVNKKNEKYNYLLSKKGMEIKHINNPTIEQYKIAVENDISVLDRIGTECYHIYNAKDYINNGQMNEVFIYALKINPRALKYINRIYLTNKLYNIAIRYGCDLRFIPKKKLKNMSLHHSLIALKYEKENINYIQPKYFNDCLKYDGLLLKHIKSHTKENVDIALNQNTLAFQFVNNEFKTIEMCKKIIKLHPELKKYSLMYCDLFENKEILNEMDDCLICCSNCKYFCKLKCGHMLCISCSTKMTKCYYRCDFEIDFSLLMIRNNKM